ncbi:MAG: hypothetical protein KDD66_18565 [Bdellovibrionales bacterium]|nr:hypothetical protein [Bdellovibrionales bacterium]
MKKLVVLLTLLFAVNASAENLQDTVELMRSDLRTEKKEIIAASMNLSSEESAKFWPLYQKFEMEMVKIGDRQLKLIDDYGKTFQSMNNKNASDLTKRALEIQEDQFEARRNFTSTLQKEINPVIAARFLQIESQITRLVNAQIASQVPLVRMPMKKQG